jgi:hypothetical protein
MSLGTIPEILLTTSVENFPRFSECLDNARLSLYLIRAWKGDLTGKIVISNSPPRPMSNNRPPTTNLATLCDSQERELLKVQVSNNRGRFLSVYRFLQNKL